MECLHVARFPPNLLIRAIAAGRSSFPVVHLPAGLGIMYLSATEGVDPLHLSCKQDSVSCRRAISEADWSKAHSRFDAAQAKEWRDSRSLRHLAVTCDLSRG